MRNIFTFLTALVLIAYSAAGVKADVITFDDLPAPASDGTAVPDNYGGLIWTNFYYINAESNDYYPSGFDAKPAPSEPNVAFTTSLGTKPAKASTYGAPFDFISARFTAVWNDNLSIHVDGYKNGLLKYSTSPDFYVDTSVYTLKEFNWSDIDQLTFTSSGGTLHQGYDWNIGKGATWFAIDNVIVVPEPSILVMLAGTSVMLMLVCGRRLVGH